MPNRKRAKGKARKAKAATSGRHLLHWTDLVYWGEKNEDVKCSHGSKVPTRNHPVYGFMTSYYEAMRNNVIPMEYLRDTFDECKQLWDDEEQRMMATRLMRSMGVNAILLGCLNIAKPLSASIVLLESYQEDSDFGSAIVNATVSGAMRKLCEGNERDLLRLFSKKIDCGCLKRQYAMSKELSKVGSCSSCDKKVDRASLLLCR